MAVEANCCQNMVLAASDIEKIAHLEQYAGKELLAEKLDIPQYEDVDDKRKALFVSYIYNNIMFATEKGFPWEHVGLVVKFAHEYLKRILVENHQLSDAIKDFTETALIIEPLCDRHKKQYTDFVYDTILCHYNLYKYVFLHPRNVVKAEVVQTVEVPPHPLPLSEGENVIIWEYNNKIRDVDMMAAQALQEQQEMKDKLSKLSTYHMTLENLSSVPLPYNERILKDLVTDVFSDFAEKKEMELKLQVDEMVSDLSFKFQKTAIPRPPELGAPPRYKSQSPPHSGSMGTIKMKGKAFSASSDHAARRKSTFTDSKR